MVAVTAAQGALPEPADGSEGLAMKALSVGGPPSNHQPQLSGKNVKGPRKWGRYLRGRSLNRSQPGHCKCSPG